MAKKDKYTFETKIRGRRADARMTQQELADQKGIVMKNNSVILLVLFFIIVVSSSFMNIL